MALVLKARSIAIDYYLLTEKPLGITGEVGEFEAARILSLTLSAEIQQGSKCPLRVDPVYESTARLGPLPAPFRPTRPCHREAALGRELCPPGSHRWIMTAATRA